ncbi:non-specific lipid transfer protein GPI-anchored 5-like [Amaranthus tricolor]|uniref:non-specific lipid transfer protein GPI-anchored 5-like n=1 Tax=Amaranthus tricolor TaxID=29722 RepID=UPI002590FEFC|nr:non-specific lipid transfer protein GPI-anchored 5-like [Amaranthus tricolor]
METPKYVIVIVLAISLTCTITIAQPSSSGISNECTNVLVTLSPCLNYITGNSSTPSSDCCTQLGSVVRSSPKCLCEVLNGGSSLAAGLNINATQALTLPAACNVKTPPRSICNNALSPAGSPTGSPTPGGSKTTPTTGDSSNANMSKLTAIPMLLAILYVTSRALAF